MAGIYNSGGGFNTTQTYRKPVTSGDQFGLSAATLVSLTPPIGATIAVITVESASIRYRDDGTAPTSSTGTPVTSGTTFQYSGPLNFIQFIAQTGSPTLDVMYYESM